MNHQWTVADLRTYLSRLPDNMEIHITTGVNEFGEVIARPMDDECIHIAQNSICNNGWRTSEEMLFIGDVVI